jgi:hypothetical protein
LVIEVKSGGIDRKQLAALAAYRAATGRQFVIVFLQAPSAGDAKAIVRAGGDFRYLFD